MRIAIDLNHQLRRVAIEVGDVRPEPMLAAETQAEPDRREVCPTA
jgi:hypothetical protein